MQERYTTDLRAAFERDRANLIKWLDGIRFELTWVEGRIDLWEDRALNEPEIEELNKALEDTSRMENIISTLNFLYDELQVEQAVDVLTENY